VKQPRRECSTWAVVSTEVIWWVTNFDTGNAVINDSVEIFVSSTLALLQQTSVDIYKTQCAVADY